MSTLHDDTPHGVMSDGIYERLAEVRAAEHRAMVELGIVQHLQPAAPARCVACDALNDPTNLDAPCRCCEEGPLLTDPELIQEARDFARLRRIAEGWPEDEGSFGRLTLREAGIVETLRAGWDR